MVMIMGIIIYLLVSLIFMLYGLKFILVSIGKVKWEVTNKVPKKPILIIGVISISVGISIFLYILVTIFYLT